MCVTDNIQSINYSTKGINFQYGNLYMKTLIIYKVHEVHFCFQPKLSKINL